MVDEIFYERARIIYITQLSAHLEVPVGERAVTQAVPDTEPEPGKGGQQSDNQIHFSRLFPDPAEQDEAHQGRMKNDEKFIQKNKHVLKQPSH